MELSVDLSTQAIILLAVTALFNGISKTGIPGLGIVFVVLVPLAIPAKVSTGYILPFLIFGDIMAVLYWRRSAVWGYVFAVLPAMLVGIIIGYFIMGEISDLAYGRVLGGVVLFLIGLDWARRYFGIPVPKDSRVLSYSIGLLAGILTMMANAAGPVVMLYLLAMNISKEEFVGTSAWIYFVINLFKVPFSMSLGLITFGSLQVNFMLLPFVVLGGVLGVKVMRKLPLRIFENLMRTLAFLGGVKLLF